VNKLRLFRPVFFTFASIFALFIVAVPANAVQSGGIGGRPANPDPSNARTKSIFIYELKANESKADAILLMNNTDKEETINIYAVDGILTNSGAYSCKQAVESKDDVGAWVNLSETQVVLAANSTKQISFTTTVPATADVGEHNGCMVFQSNTDEGDVQGNVRVRTRQAVRIAVTIPGDLKKEVSVKSFTVGKLDQYQQFLLTAKNGGNVSADIDARVVLRTLWGSNVYNDGGGYPVLAQNDLQLNFLNEKPPFWGGWYKASAQVTYDTRAGVFSVDESGKLVTKKSSVITVFVNPQPAAWLIYAGFLLVVLGLVLFWIARRREQNIVATWPEYIVKKGDILTSLAADRGISWKVVARANRLKAPYVIASGDTIKLPEQPAPTKLDKKSRNISKKG
jgi:hypothetical protein